MTSPTPALQNNKDYFDQGLDEVKLLQYVNSADPHDESGLLRLFDFFYFKVSLVKCQFDGPDQTGACHAPAHSHACLLAVHGGRGPPT